MKGLHNRCPARQSGRDRSIQVVIERVVGMQDVCILLTQVALKHPQQRQSIKRRHRAIRCAPQVDDARACLLQFAFSLRVVTRVSPAPNAHGVAGAQLAKGESPHNFLKPSVVEVGN